ncbi:MAG TPA: MBL fold metallo-hydrolase [Candidatus Thermoplasmatota archaeon]|nr:MBL fold metallo-hydrolase [Candidatus Thermoplasmatota archaeon]
MRVTVLGNSGRLLLPLGAGASYLLEAAGRRVLLDATNGTHFRLAGSRLDAVVMTHLHLDAFADMLPVLASLDRPTPFFVPAGAERHIRDIFDRRAMDPKAIALAEMRPASAGSEAWVGDLRLRFAKARHGCIAVALRADADGAALAYLADTGARPGLVDLARGADLVVAHTLLLDREAGKEVATTNMTAGQAGRLAREAGARRLALAHVPFYLRREDSLLEAKGHFGGEAFVLEDGRAYDVRAE